MKQTTKNELNNELKAKEVFHNLGPDTGNALSCELFSCVLETIDIFALQVLDLKKDYRGEVS